MYLFIVQKNCLGTIRNIANVCCVQFSAHSSHLLAFGSADYKTYCYDLRNAKSPWCILAGHDKAVSYVKFLDAETLVSASTDNSLKIWDLNQTSSTGLSMNACSLTLSGHTNEKVGFSVLESGYISLSSEVWIYFVLQLHLWNLTFSCMNLLPPRTLWVCLLRMDMSHVVQKPMR